MSERSEVPVVLPLYLLLQPQVYSGVAEGGLLQKEAGLLQVCSPGQQGPNT